MGKWAGLVLLWSAGAWGQAAPVVVEHGTYTVHLLLHAIGREEYAVTEAPDGGLEMATTSELSDRGSKRASKVRLLMRRGFVPMKLIQESVPAAADGGQSAEVMEAFGDGEGGRGEPDGGGAEGGVCGVCRDAGVVADDDDAVLAGARDAGAAADAACE